MPKNVIFNVFQNVQVEGLNNGLFTQGVPLIRDYLIVLWVSPKNHKKQSHQTCTWGPTHSQFLTLAAALL